MRPALALEGRKGASAGSRFVHKSNKDLSDSVQQDLLVGPGYEFALTVQQGVCLMFGEETGTEQWLPTRATTVLQAGVGKGADWGHKYFVGKWLGSNLGEPCLLVQP